MSDDRKANGVYKPEEYDTIAFPMVKGCKDSIKAHCDASGETYHSFLRRAVVNQISHDREAIRARSSRPSRSGSRTGKREPLSSSHLLNKRETTMHSHSRGCVHTLQTVFELFRLRYTLWRSGRAETQGLSWKRAGLPD